MDILYNIAIEKGRKEFKEEALEVLKNRPSYDKAENNEQMIYKVYDGYWICKDDSIEAINNITL
jgi:hypothetical protein